MTRYASPDEYYDFLPEQSHSPGDIWHGLPTLGLLKPTHTAGLVVSPACDLGNNKTETITYLPILSVEQWYASGALLTDVRGATQGALNAYCASTNRDSIPLNPPLEQSTKDAVDTIGLTASGKHALIHSRALAGLHAIQLILSSTQRAELAGLQALFGEKEWRARHQRIITNALRADAHFLPSPEKKRLHPDSLSTHSVALFRYPITAPLEVLDLANATDLPDWPNALSRHGTSFAVAHFRNERPLKIGRLRAGFVEDLLTRYTALYTRIGSPDFSPATIARIASKIGPNQ